MSHLSPSRFVVRWSLLTALGLAGGVIAALLLGGPIEALVGMILVTPVLTAMVGAVLGASQWLELRRLLAHPGRWVVATCLGLGAGLAAGVVVVEVAGGLLTGGQVNVLALGVAERALSMAVVGLVAGGCLGGAQSLVLRWPAVRAARWAGVTALALGAGFPAGSLLVDGAVGGLGSPLGVLLFVLSSGAVLGAATARPLLRAA